MNVQRIRRVALVLLFVVAAASPVRAQAVESAGLESLSLERIALLSMPAAPPLSPTPSGRPLYLALTTAFVGLQALDTVTTLHGIHHGSAVEANPFVGGLAQHPAAFVAVKSALTAATVVSMNSLSKKHPKGALIAMLALNAGSAFVVRSNLQITMGR